MTETTHLLPTLLVFMAVQAPATGSNAGADAQSSSTPLLLFGGIALVLFVIVGIVLLARRK